MTTTRVSPTWYENTTRRGVINPSSSFLMGKERERTASIQTPYIIFIGVGFALIGLGAFDVLLDHTTSLGWEAKGLNRDAIGMIASGALAITVADRFFNRDEGTLAPPES